MANDSAPIEFYGFLGRIGTRDEGVDLRFYPFAFATEFDARVVLIVRLEGAHFQTKELNGLLGDEVEATVFLDRAEVHSVFGGTTTILQANGVTAEWTSYDAEDLLQRVRQLQDDHDRLNRSLAQSVAKNRKGLALVQELQRRAEIKAAASDECTNNDRLPHWPSSSGSNDISKPTTKQCKRGRDIAAPFSDHFSKASGSMHPRLPDLQPVLSR